MTLSPIWGQPRRSPCRAGESLRRYRGQHARGSSTSRRRTLVTGRWWSCHQFGFVGTSPIPGSSDLRNHAVARAEGVTVRQARLRPASNSTPCRLRPVARRSPVQSPTTAVWQKVGRARRPAGLARQPPDTQRGASPRCQVQRPPYRSRRSKHHPAADPPPRVPASPADPAAYSRIQPG